MRSSRIKLRYVIAISVFAWIGAIAQSGGQFAVRQSVVAGGGAASAGGSFTLIGTTGQAAAGVTSIAQPFRERGGFWQGDLAPTAAHVSISGRAVSPAGVGLPRTVIVLTAVSNGTIRTSITNGFGYFRIDDIEAGRNYILQAHHKQLQFAPQVIHVVDDVIDLQLTALP